MKIIEKNGIRLPLAQGTEYELKSTMGDRTVFGKADWHEGIDLSVVTGTPVLAVEAGEVVRVFSGCTVDDGKQAGFGYGNHVVIKHGNNVYSLVAHNSEIFVKEGDTVNQGQKIALSGNTGYSSGPHIHFELVQGTDSDTWVDHWKITRKVKKTNRLDRLDPLKFKWS